MIDIRAINNEINAAKQGEKKAIVRRYAELAGVSEATIYRQIRNEFGPKKEVERSKIINDEIINAIARIKLEGKTGTSERELATDLAIEIARMRGIDAPENLSPSTVNRRLKEAGFRNRTPIKRIEAEYANQQHQLDFSRSKYFQLADRDTKTGDYILKATSKSMAYKENENSLRTWYAGITDAYSRLSIAQVYAATGENSLTGREFLHFAYNREEDEHPLRYLPDILKTDNGAFIKDSGIQKMLERLAIKSELVLPYQKHGIQKRESGWKMLWQRFELKQFIIMGEGKTIYLREFNELIHEFMIDLLEWEHPIKRETRGHVYRASLAQHPARLLEGDLREVAFKVEYRTVNDALQVRLKKEIFEAPQYACGKRIGIYRNMLGEVVGELADEHRKPFILKPTQGYSVIGDYRREFEPTYTQKIEKEMKEEKKRESKIKYLEPKIEKKKVESIFESAIDERASFNNSYEAKVYIGKNLPAGESYADYEEVFDPLLEQGGLDRKGIDTLLFYINNKQATGG